VNNSHWVLSSSVGGIFRVYDSLLTKKISGDLKKQMNDLYSPDDGDITIDRLKCQQQIGGLDCCVFAIAFAVDISMGNDITKMRYDQFKMRGHLISCLKNEILTPFPKRRCDAEAESADRIQGDWEIPARPVRQNLQRKIKEVITLNNSFSALDTTPEAEKEIQPIERQEEKSPKRLKWKKGDLIIPKKVHTDSLLSDFFGPLMSRRFRRIPWEQQGKLRHIFHRMRSSNWSLLLFRQLAGLAS
jgi:hypothetical protein